MPQSIPCTLLATPPRPLRRRPNLLMRGITITRSSVALTCVDPLEGGRSDAVCSTASRPPLTCDLHLHPTLGIQAHLEAWRRCPNRRSPRRSRSRQRCPLTSSQAIGEPTLNRDACDTGATCPSRFCLRTAPSTTALHRCECAAGWFTVLVSNLIPQRGRRARALRRGAPRIRNRPPGRTGHRAPRPSHQPLPQDHQPFP